MSWWSVIPIALAAIGLFFVPGALVAWASRVRGMALFAVAPAITVSIVAVAALIAPVANMRWSVTPVLILAILVSGVALAVSTRLVKKDPNGAPTTINWWAAAGHAAAVSSAAFLIGRRLVSAFGRPEAFSQTFDNVFHLNAVRYIQETGSGSSFSVSGMTGGGFYPSAWHDLVALLADVTGASIPVSANITNLVVGSIVWPLGCIFLAHKILGNRVVVSVAAGILSAGFGAFPLLLLDFGVLYPNFLGNALVPTSLALAVQALGLAQQASTSRVVDSLLLFSVVPGVMLAHPSSAMALLGLLVSPFVFLWIRATVRIVRGRRNPWPRIGGMVVLLALGAAVLAVTWQTVRPVEAAATWAPIETTGRAIGEVITSSAIGRPVSWLVMTLAIAGLISLLRRREKLWLVGIYLIMAGLFVVVASFPFGPQRTFFTGVWYNDPPRLASLLPIVILPLATVGAVRCWDVWILPLTARYASWRSPGSAQQGERGAPWAGVAAAFVLTGFLAVGTQQANVREAQLSAQAGYRISADSPLISSDEMALISRIPNEIPKDATMVGNPWNGSALAYAFTGRKLIQLHMLSELPSGTDQLYQRLNMAGSDPTLCPIVERLDVRYVLDFGHQEVHGGDNGFRGLDNLEAAGVATLVDSQGRAKLYKLTACGQ